MAVLPVECLSAQQCARPYPSLEYLNALICYSTSLPTVGKEAGRVESTAPWNCAAGAYLFSRCHQQQTINTKRGV
nr:hypothetical protein Q903MT_gene1960 [Picea sitchensis]